MEFFHGTKFDFVGARWVCYGISIALTLAALLATIFIGPQMGIEFSGGSLIQARFDTLPPIDAVRSALERDGWKNIGLQTEPAQNSVVIRLKQGEGGEHPAPAIMASLTKAFPKNVHENADRVDFIGPVVGQALKRNALFAIFGSFAVIVIYVAFRFKNWIWGVVGVAALMHDVFATWGLLLIFHREMTLVVVAALLTLAGYSINDTIVIFDRIRENLRKSRKEPIRDLYNRSINETLGRTIMTSAMALVASISLFWAGEVVRDFAISMTFGIIVGTYSSIAGVVAAVYAWETHRRKKA